MSMQISSREWQYTSNKLFVILDTPLVEMPLLLLYDLTGLGCKRLCTKPAPWLCSLLLLFL